MSSSWSLAQRLLDKERSDLQMMSGDHSSWYNIDSSALPVSMSDRFFQLSYDKGTEDFLQNSLDISNRFILQAYFSVASALLSYFMARTSSNGLLNRGKMFVFSAQHLLKFLEIPNDWNSFNKNVLDIGAGDGQVTSVLSQFYSNVSATEISLVMQWRLQKKGFKVLPIENWKEMGPFDLVSALNILDRHYNPLSLLADLHEVTAKYNTFLLLAVVLPINQYVEFHPNTKKTLPDSKLPISGRSFEEQAVSLMKFFTKSNFELIRWTKLPYLCEGDFDKGYYVLSDAIFLLRPINDNGANCPRQSTGSIHLQQTVHDTSTL